ncbi:hypothetical protein HanIR_Chr08g0363581 [Helianthus annuus]|nr:hypothetical protein HanIR_Chr08g0363581 [Helianthus annuus]
MVAHMRSIEGSNIFKSCGKVRGGSVCDFGFIMEYRKQLCGGLHVFHRCNRHMRPEGWRFGIP